MVASLGRVQPDRMAGAAAANGGCPGPGSDHVGPGKLAGLWLADGVPTRGRRRRLRDGVGRWLARGGVPGRPAVRHAEHGDVVASGNRRLAHLGKRLDRAVPGYSAASALSVRLEITHEARGSRARAGVLHTPHGRLDTPFFCIVGTAGSVKGVTPAELREVGAEVLLANTYHLFLRPGAETVRALGGLHRFMAWDGPIITDSGGFQVFSLGFGKEHGVGKQIGMFPGALEKAPRPRGQAARLVNVDEDGATFTSHIDGSRQRLTPESSIAVQEALGADIILAFDEPTSPLHDAEYTRQAMLRTHRWAERCLAARH